MAYTLLIERDQENGQILMHVVDDADGTDVDGQPNVKIKLADTKGSDTNYHPIAFHEMCVITSAAGVTPVTYGTVMVLCSEPY